MDNTILNSKLEQSFDSFCKTVIRNESKNLQKKRQRQAKYEASISALTFAETHELDAEDTYELDSMVFLVGDNAFTVHDPELSNAITYLDPRWREIVLLSFFLGYTDAQIGRKMKMTKEAIKYRKLKAIEELRERLEEIEHGQS